MAPGQNGNDRTPGSKDTGTVPKTKKINAGSGLPQPSGAQQDQRSRSMNTPNNLGRAEWQSSEDRLQRISRKTSNAESHPNLARHGYFTDRSCMNCLTNEPASSALALSKDTLYEHLTQQLNGQLSNVERPLLRDMSESDGSLGCVTPTSQRGEVGVQRSNSGHEKDGRHNKIVNVPLTKLPDRIQVTRRLSQIQDYIRQTTSLMTSLKNSRDPSHRAQYNKLLLMVSDLRDSELKLQIIVNGLDAASEEDGEGDTENGGSSSSSTPATINGPRGFTTSTPEDSALSRRGPVEQEMYENLQAQQASLLALQNQAEAQLREAQIVQDRLRAQTSLMSDHAGIASTTSSEAPKLDTQLENIQGRLTNLHEMYDNRNELAHMLGERDEELNSEYLRVQNKLVDIQKKKREMNQMMEEVASGQPISHVTQAAINQTGCVTRGDDESDSSSGHPDGLTDPNNFNGDVDHDPFGLHAKLDAARNLKTYVTAVIRAAGLEPDSQEMSPVGNCVERRESYTESELRSEGTEKPDNTYFTPDPDRNCNIRKKINEDASTAAKIRLAQIQGILSIVTQQYKQGQPIARDVLDQLQSVTQHSSTEDSSDDAPPKSRLSRSSDAYASQHCSKQRSNSRDLTESTNNANRVAHFTSGSSSGEDLPARDPSITSCPAPPEFPALPPITNRSSNSQATANQSGHDEPQLSMSLEEIREMTRSMQLQTLGMRAHSASLAVASKQVKKVKEELPLRKKKTNTQALSQQMLSELQARKGEFEGLMRKDKGRTSAANQDNCGEVSPNKSEAQGYSFVGTEASSLATANWPSTSIPLDATLPPNLSDTYVISGNTSSDEENEPKLRSNIPSPFIRNNRELPRRNMDAMSTHSAQSLPARSISTQRTAEPSVRASQPEAQRNVWPQLPQLPRHLQNVGLAMATMACGTHGTATSVTLSSNPQPAPPLMSSSSEWLTSQICNLQKENSRLRHENSQYAYLRDTVPPFSYHPGQFPSPGMPVPHPETYCLRTMSTAIDQCSQMLLQQHQELAALRSIIAELMDQMTRNDRIMQYMFSPQADVSQQQQPPPQPPNLYDSRHSNLSRNQPPQLKLPFSGGAGQVPDIGAAHSLPNLARDVDGAGGHPDALNSYASMYLALPPIYGSNNPNVPLIRFPVDRPWVHEGPAPTLNNQVPPGNRTNNYLDNFRSYSRQNLLSAGGSRHKPRGDSRPSMLAANLRNATQPHLSDHTNHNVNRRDDTYSLYSHEDERSSLINMPTTAQPDSFTWPRNAFAHYNYGDRIYPNNSSQSAAGGVLSRNHHPRVTGQTLPCCTGQECSVERIESGSSRNGRTSNVDRESNQSVLNRPRRRMTPSRNLPRTECRRQPVFCQNLPSMDATNPESSDSNFSPQDNNNDQIGLPEIFPDEHVPEYSSLTLGTGSARYSLPNMTEAYRTEDYEDIGQFINYVESDLHGNDQDMFEHDDNMILSAEISYPGNLEPYSAANEPLAQQHLEMDLDRVPTRLSMNKK